MATHSNDNEQLVREYVMTLKTDDIKEAFLHLGSIMKASDREELIKLTTYLIQYTASKRDSTLGIVIASLSANRVGRVPDTLKKVEDYPSLYSRIVELVSD